MGDSSSSSQVPWGGFMATLVSILAIVASSYVAFFFIDIFTSLTDDTIIYNFIYTGIHYSLTLAAVLLYVTYKKGKFVDFGFRKFPVFKSVIYLLNVLFFAYVLGGMALTALEVVFPNINLDQSQATGFQNAAGTLELFMAFMVLVVTTPIFEEIIFRGFIFQGFQNRFGSVLSAVVTSVLFAALHAPISASIVAGILGLGLTLVFVKTNSIVPAILLHSAKNLIAFIVIYQVF